MYSLTLTRGGFIRAASIQRALANVGCAVGGVTHLTRMHHIGNIERIGARGISYSNEDFDILSSAMNFLDAVAPELATDLRTNAER